QEAGATGQVDVLRNDRAGRSRHSGGGGGVRGGAHRPLLLRPGNIVRGLLEAVPPYGNEPPVRGERAAHLSGCSGCVEISKEEALAAGPPLAPPEGTPALGRQVAGAIDPVLPSIVKSRGEVRGRRSKSSRGLQSGREASRSLPHLLFAQRRLSGSGDLAAPDRAEPDGAGGPRARARR